MKQHPDSVNRDLDDEVAEAIEHQYARRLLKRAGGRDGTLRQKRRSAKSKAEDDGLGAETDRPSEKGGL